jgi:tetratricopeptide (TPR) repeat protein
LFLEELAWTVQEQGALRLPPEVPDTVQAVLTARIDRLPPVAKQVLQTAAVIGPEGRLSLLQALTVLPEAVLQQSLHRLQTAEFLYATRPAPDYTYAFKHVLTQEAAYQSLLQHTRQQMHQQVARVLEAQFPTMAETQPEVLAQHYTVAGLAEEAVGYWQRAGEHSAARSAYVEAVEHLTKGLEVLQTLPATSTRDQQELDAQMALGQALSATKGQASPQTGHTYARARELCQQVETSPQLCGVLTGLATFYQNRGESQTALELYEEGLSLAQRQQDPTLLMRAHYPLGDHLYWLGEFVFARVHLQQALALSPHQYDCSLVRAKVVCLSFTALTLWSLGYPDQALRRSHEALTLVQELPHAHTLVRALFYAAWLHQLRREVRFTQERAEASLALSTAQGFAQWMRIGMFYRGWAMATQGHGAEGLAQMQQSRTASQAAGQGPSWPLCLALLAEVYGRIGQSEDGLCLFAESLGMVDKTGYRCHVAEVYRLKGELLLRQAVPDTSQAEGCYQLALVIARCQQA